MNRLRHPLLWIALIVAMLPVATSCDDEYDGPYDYLSGYWCYQGRVDGDNYESDYNEFFFAPDGSGTYSCYSEGGYGPWTSYNIDWYVNGDYITIDVWGWDTWTYSYTVSPRWLYLYPTDGGPALIYSSN